MMMMMMIVVVLFIYPTQLLQSCGLSTDLLRFVKVAALRRWIHNEIYTSFNQLHHFYWLSPNICLNILPEYQYQYIPVVPLIIHIEPPLI